MCWSADVSAVFAVGLAAGAVVLFRRSSNKHRFAAYSAEFEALRGSWNFWIGEGSNAVEKLADRARWHSLIVLVLCLVQLSEFFIWLDVRPRPDLNERESCPVLNKAATFGVFLSGYMSWPLVINIWGFFSSDGKNERFRVTSFLGALVSASYLLKLIIGEATENERPYWVPEGHETWQPDAFQKWGTCSYSDPDARHAVLYWNFAFAELPWLPGGFPWFLMAVVPVPFYIPRFTALSVFTLGSLTYVIPRAILPSGETMSIY